MTSTFFVSNVCKHFGNVRQLPFDSPLSFPLGHLFLWLQHYFSGCQLYLLFSLWFMTFSLHLCLCGACMHYVYKHIHNFPYTFMVLFTMFYIFNPSGIYFDQHVFLCNHLEYSQVHTSTCCLCGLE